MRDFARARAHTHTHTNTHTYIYIYIYIYLHGEIVDFGKSDKIRKIRGKVNKPKY